MLFFPNIHDTMFHETQVETSFSIPLFKEEKMRTSPLAVLFVSRHESNDSSIIMRQLNFTISNVDSSTNFWGTALIIMLLRRY